jgi:hypothetical protein
MEENCSFYVAQRNATLAPADDLPVQSVANPFWSNREAGDPISVVAQQYHWSLSSMFSLVLEAFLL